MNEVIPRWIVIPVLVVCLLNGRDGSAQEKIGADLAASARDQIGRTLHYDPSYVSLTYPGGDVPVDRGVCTDVVIRALRSATGMDLQKEVHEDMSRNFREYPKLWGLVRPDKNIDHRRVPNLICFFKRKGFEIARVDGARELKPGDLVTCLVPPNLPHIMVVSDRVNRSGLPLVIHNIGAGVQEEDRLLDFKWTGCFRIEGGGLHRSTGVHPSAIAQPPKPLDERTYVVGTRNDGGTLSGIARLFYGEAAMWKRIFHANRDKLKDPDLIRNGMTLVLPPAE